MLHMRRICVGALLSLLASSAIAQFTGPSAAGRASTVAQLNQARLGSYVTVTGQVVDHQRQNYYTFRDKTGEIRVEIAESLWQGRKVSPETRVRLLGEVSRGLFGRYLWVKTLDVVN